MSGGTCTCGVLSRKHMHAHDCPAQTAADRAMHARIADMCSTEGCEEGVLVVRGELVDCPECWPSGGPLGGTT